MNEKELLEWKEYLINTAEYKGDLTSCEVEKCLNECNRQLKEKEGEKQ